MKRLNLCMFCLLLAACEDVFEKDISDGVMEIVAPCPDWVTSEQTVTFLWHLMEGCDDYHLLVVSPSFKAAGRVVTDTVVSAYRFTQTFPVGKYEWVIYGRNSAYTSLPQCRFFEIKEEYEE